MAKKMGSGISPNDDLIFFLFWTGLFLLVLFLCWAIKGGQGNRHTYYVITIFYFGGVLLLLNTAGQHKKMLFGRRLSPLATFGFKIENKEKYWGYKGNYRDYFMRIFYEPTSGWNGNGELFIVIYYQVSVGQSAREVLGHLKSKYEYGRWLVTSFWNNYQLNVSYIDVTRSEVFFTIFSFEQVKRRIDFMVNLAEMEKLLPLTEAQVNEVIDSDLDYAPRRHHQDFSK